MSIPTTSVTKALSKSQKHILSLYRSMLRASKGKDPNIEATIKSEFRKNSKIPRKSLLLVEFHIRQAEKKLDLLTGLPNVTGYKP